MKLSKESLENIPSWEAMDIHAPAFDWQTMRENTLAAPTWVHFGAGNIFRAQVARLQQELLEQNKAETGIVVVETYDEDIIKKAYRPYDNLSLVVHLLPNGTTETSVVASLADSWIVSENQAELKDAFAAPSLQMASLTITEKGYAVRTMEGELLPIVAQDLSNGPDNPQHVMSILTALLYHRFTQGKHPIAMVSMDNCSKNGQLLQQSLLTIAQGWQVNDFVPADFIFYLKDSSKVSFPWSMIDKITPSPTESVQQMLEDKGLSGMEITRTDKGSIAAPFTNAEKIEYLVIEDSFPNGRPALEDVGVLFADQDTVNKTERMKVTTCLNPLHTSLAIFGCLLGFDKISEQMKDPQLKKLVEVLGYDEGLPVVENPGIIDSRQFLKEVLELRLPNPFLPDTPQRIATDTSQKVAIRFGETIKAYLANPEEHSIENLVALPVSIAGWFRYLLGVDDELQPMTLSRDPMLEELQQALEGIVPGTPDSYTGQLRPLLEHQALFGVNLYDSPLRRPIEDYFVEMLKGKGAVRSLLERLFPE